MILNSDMLYSYVCHDDTVRMYSMFSHLRMLTHKCIRVFTCMTDTNMSDGANAVTYLCIVFAVYGICCIWYMFNVCVVFVCVTPHMFRLSAQSYVAVVDSHQFCANYYDVHRAMVKCILRVFIGFLTIDFFMRKQT